MGPSRFFTNLLMAFSLTGGPLAGAVTKCECLKPVESPSPEGILELVSSERRPGRLLRFRIRCATSKPEALKFSLRHGAHSTDFAVFHALKRSDHPPKTLPSSCELEESLAEPMEAWAAVPLLQEEMKMEISLQTQDGKRIAYQTLNLEPPKIEESRIRIAKKFTENLPLMRIEKERLQNEKVFSKHQEPRLFYGEFVPPMAGDLGKLTLSDFGKRRIINGVPARPHYGTDLRAAVGTPVMAPARGRVVMASDQFFSGKIMILDHGIGLFTYAIHLSKFLKKVGDLVEPGEVIALSGATGRVEGPHLHWSAKLRGVNFDAMDLIRSRLVPPETVETPGRSGIPSPGPS